MTTELNKELLLRAYRMMRRIGVSAYRRVGVSANTEM